MKRFSLTRMARLCALTVALCAALSVSALAGFNGSYVVDEAGILTDAQAQTLENQAASMAETYNFGVYLVILDDYTEYGYDDAYDFALAPYEEWGYGLGDDHDGEMLFMSMDNRQYALLYHGYGEIAFTEGGRDSLETAVVDRFRNNDWVGGFGQYMDWSEYLLEAAANGEPVGWDEYGDYHPDDEELGIDRQSYDDDEPGLFEYGLTVGIPLVITVIVCLCLLGQMHSVQEATEAKAYAVPNSLDIRRKVDRFTHETESRVKVESEHSDSGGGGGSSHHSGGGYSGRSGSF